MPKTNFSLPRLLAKIRRSLPLSILIFIMAVGSVAALWQYSNIVRELEGRAEKTEILRSQAIDLTEILNLTQAELDAIKEDDQFVRNETLQEEISNIQKVFSDTVDAYDRLLRLEVEGAQRQPLETLFASTLTHLSERDYEAASDELDQLNQRINRIIADRQAAAAAPPPAPPATVPTVQDAPDSGYRRQAVDSGVGVFQVDVIAADLNSTRVQVETASESDCSNDCPVTSLADYVARSGGFAGVNGPYFCPAEYPACAGKTNSFDTLLMNKNKYYFNSDQNVYSTVPAVIFSGNSARFVGQSLEWGRDTGVDAVIAGQPLLLSGGEIRFGGGGEPSQGIRSGRSFIGTKDNTVYIGVVRNATVAETAHVLKAMGLHNALNLDAGGSTALYLNGRYLAGPGRNTPFGIVLVRK